LAFFVFVTVISDSERDLVLEGLLALVAFALAKEDVDPTVQTPTLENLCPSCPFVPAASNPVSFNVDPKPGISVQVSFNNAQFKLPFNAGRFLCKNYVKFLFSWVSAGEASGDACAAGNFHCPITAGVHTEVQTLNVPSNAIKSSYYSHCQFFETSGAETLYADAKIFFKID